MHACVGVSPIVNGLEQKCHRGKFYGYHVCLVNLRISWLRQEGTIAGVACSTS